MHLAASGKKQIAAGPTFGGLGIAQSEAHKKSVS